MSLVAVFSLLLAAQATPDGFVETRSTQQCTFSVGPARASGVSPIHAACRWPHISLAAVDAAFGDFSSSARIHETVAEATVTRRAPGVTEVLEIHTAPTIAPRQAHLRYTRAATDRVVRWRWELTDPQPPLRPRHLAELENTGSWTFTAPPGGGVEVIHQLTYEPGGSVPAWLIRLFQTRAVSRFCDELHAAASEARPVR